MKRRIDKVIVVVMTVFMCFSSSNSYALTTSKWKSKQYSMNITTEGILSSDVKVTEFTNEFGFTSREYELTYTIPEGFDDDILTIVPTGYINDCALPGLNDKFIIKIKNNSNNSYSYIDESFVLSVEDFSIYSDEEIGTQVSDAYSFSDVAIRENISFYRTKNSALQKLYNVNKTSSLTNEMLKDEEIEKKLDKEKYPNGILDLNKYYLDFYNEKYKTTANNLEDLPDIAISELLDGNYTKSVKESNKEVIELAFNYLYNKLLAFSFSDQEINDENSQEYSVGSYMRKENSYQFANKLLKKNLTNLGTNNQAEIIMPHVYLNGAYTTNIYMNYYIGFYLELKLQKDNKETEIEKIETKEEEIIIPPKTDYAS